MAHTDQSTLASKLHLPLALLAVLAMAGFLVWLGVTAEPTDLAMDDQIPEEELEAADEVSHEDFAADPSAWEDSLIRLVDVRADQMVGAFAFWANIPDVEDEEEEEEVEPVRQFFVLADRVMDLRQFGVAVPEDEDFELVGEVRSVDPEIIEAWTDRGIVPSAQAEEVEGLETYVLVHQLPEVEAQAAEGEEMEEPEAADGTPEDANNGDEDEDPGTDPDL